MKDEKIQSAGEIRMMDTIRVFMRLFGFAVLGMTSILSFASSSGSRSQDETTPKSVAAARQISNGQSRTLLPDGRLLLIGGKGGDGETKIAYFQDPQTGTVTQVSGELSNARAFHSATLLPSGSVLVFGGIGDRGDVLPNAELFDPVKQSFIEISMMGLTRRAHHTATLLTDGRVLFAGGDDDQGKTLDQIEAWDYRTNQSSTLVVSLKTPRRDHSATLLPDGTVRLWGGQDGKGGPLNNGEIIDPNGPSVRPIERLTESMTEMGPPNLAASIPQNGQTEVPLDQVISLRFSRSMAVTTLNSGTITLKAFKGDVNIVQVVPAEGGMLAFITPQDYLQNGTSYTLSIAGATDQTGRALPDKSISFTTVTADDSATNQGDGSSTTSSGTSGTGWTAAPSPTGLASKWRKLPALQAGPGVTAVAGQVLTLDGSPLPNVLIQIDSQQASTNETGRFLVQNTGSGHHVMIIDGAPANSKSSAYGLYRVGVDLKASQTNALHYTIWMTALDIEHVVEIASPTTGDMVITNPTLPGVEVHIPAGSVIHDARGNVVTHIGITQIPLSQPPFPFRKGMNFPVYFTVQPGGATVAAARSVSSLIASDRSLTAGKRARGATVHYKNYMKAKPGTRFAFWGYDPYQRGWYTYGKGTVSADGAKVVPDEATQTSTLEGLSVGTAPPNKAPSPAPKCCGPQDGDPVDLQTGLFIYNKTDLVLNDVIPLSLTRTYREGDTVSRSFGIGMSMNYDLYMVGDNDGNPEGYTYQDLILADGERVHFALTNGNLAGPENGSTVYTATSTPGDFYGASVQSIYDPSFGGAWLLTKADGTSYRFPYSGVGAYETNAQQNAITAMYDRSGNALTFSRDGSTGNLLEVTSPNGRWIKFTYDASDRVIQAQDSAGRTTSYTYTAAGYLNTATDANGGVTTYTYDVDGNMLTLTDPRGIMYLQNQYDDNNMVSRQTHADGGVYQFSYTLDANLNVTQTEITDPLGHVRSATFNSDGYMTSDTRAVGMPEQQAVTYNIQQGTGILLSSTDALNRTTSYSYDAMADVTSQTSLAGTSSAVTTTMAYDQRFFELSAAADPLGNTTTYTYDNSGNMLSVTDPLGNTSTFNYNSAGQPTTATDPLGNQTQFSYNAGDLVAITDPLNRSTSRFVDAAGRVAAVTDPLGRTIRTVYDSRGEITTKIDSLGNQTAFAYDADGDLLTLTDANQHTTTFTYDSLDRPITRTDALGNQSRTQYNLYGNITQTKDRKGQVSAYTYDGLNRPTDVTFADGSTITDTYDAGNRVTGVTDSITGTINRSYDGLDDLLTETTPQGSVTYTYDADDRRQTMTVSGQAPVNYTFDNASRMTLIAQSGANVSFAYDNDGRRTSLTLPNGIVATYNYDAASQLAGITYQGGALAPANLSYSYDLAGRRTSVSGAFASTQLPAAVSAAVYNVNNQLTQWGTTSMSYDTNGSTLNDGMNSYTWDARNRLVSANNNGASFNYDPLGRRISKTILSATTNFIYDGANAVQELNGTIPTANYLTGGLDERFFRTTASVVDNYVTDALGSTVELTDSTGAAEAQYSYGPFGSESVTGSTTNSYDYTGRETDGLGINYYRARYYSPTTARFLSEDPAGFAGSGPNLYAYAFDSPINVSDPFGLSGWLTIYSSGAYGTGASGYFGSHSWISFTPDGDSATTYGTWGNNYGGAHIGLNSNIEPIALAQGDWSDAVSRSQYLSDAQQAALMNYINGVKNQGANGWSLARPCSHFASAAWQAGTGEWLPDGSPTMPSSPAGLSQSINAANAANPSLGQMMSWIWSHRLFF
jgi:RHS repeat-associated protein